MGSDELMQIRESHNSDRLVLYLVGRFDANWSQHVGEAIEVAIRSGNHVIEIDLAEVTYISSAGLGTLVNYYGKLKKASGGLRVLNPQDYVRAIFKKTGLESLLINGSTAFENSKNAVQSRSQKIDDCDYEFYPLSAAKPLTVEFVGQPDHFLEGRLGTTETVRVPLETDTFCLGLGTLESSFDEVPHRFGESLGVAGTAVTKPTDQSDVPDFVVNQGDLVAQLNLLYGVRGQGRYSRLVRFEAGKSDEGSLGLSKLISVVTNDIESEASAYVVVAETANIVGASLIRSPALAEGQKPLSFPEVRDWLTFTSERNHDRHLVVIVGVAFKEPAHSSSRFLRPFGQNAELNGHFHGCVFPYQPIPKGKIELIPTVQNLFLKSFPQTVMHLIDDHRQFEGMGETQLMRGACWCGPLVVSGSAP